MADSREKYQLNIAVKNGQAYETVTYMPYAEVQRMIRTADPNDWLVFDGINPFTDDVVHTEILAETISGWIHRRWIRPPTQQRTNQAIFQ